MGPIPGIDYEVWAREASAGEAGRRRAIEHTRALREGRDRRHVATLARWSPVNVVARLLARSRGPVVPLAGPPLAALPLAPSPVGDPPEPAASVPTTITPPAQTP